MACLLTDLTITSVDLVEQGANPGAEIMITKSEGDQKMQELTGIDQDVLKELIDKAVAEYLGSENGETVTEETAEAPEPDTVTETEASDTQESMEKQLEKRESVVKELESKIEDLEKSLTEVNRLRELDEMERFARKYESLGTDSQELAKTLLMMKEAGPEVYEQYTKSLDAQLTLERETGIFKEFGTSQSGREGEVDAVIKSYLDNGLTVGEAWEKAASDRPDLFYEYDRNYQNGGF